MQNIPLFPLPQVVLLPRSPMPLRFFETDKVAMLLDCLRNDRLIGIVQSLPDHTEPADLPFEGQFLSIPQTEQWCYRIGCVGRVVQFTEQGQDQYLAHMLGIERFYVRGFATDADITSPYLRAFVEIDSEETPDQEAAAKQARDALMKVFRRYMHAEGGSVEFLGDMPSDADALIALCSMVCPLDAHARQSLLEQPTVADRLILMGSLVEQLLQSIASAKTGAPVVQ